MFPLHTAVIVVCHRAYSIHGLMNILWKFKKDATFTTRLIVIKRESLLLSCTSLYLTIRVK